jgi:TatD DNase family protein
MQLVDTHVHLNFGVFQDDLEAIADRWREAGVVHLVHACVKPTEFSTMQALADRFPDLFLAVGLHPLSMEEWKPNLAETLQVLAQSDSRVVAIGETGLDFYKSEQQEEQYRAFAAQLQVARTLDLPVIIHCRDAAQAMIPFLQGFWQDQGPVQGVMHCWGGNPEETQAFLNLGLFISFSGTVTFKKAEAIQASARMVPSDRLLVETDCPFLAPVPQRGKRNEPAFVYHVAEQVARLRGISLEALAQQTVDNARHLFRLPSPASLI